MIKFFFLYSDLNSTYKSQLFFDMLTLKAPMFLLVQVLQAEFRYTPVLLC